MNRSTGTPAGAAGACGCAPVERARMPTHKSRRPRRRRAGAPTGCATASQPELAACDCGANATEGVPVWTGAVHRRRRRVARRPRPARCHQAHPAGSSRRVAGALGHRPGRLPGRAGAVRRRFAGRRCPGPGQRQLQAELRQSARRYRRAQRVAAAGGHPGINVWCAAGKGTFSAAEVNRVVEKTRLAEIVDHRRLVLPQLSAPGVAAHEVKRGSGFRAVFGPLRPPTCPPFWLPAWSPRRRCAPSASISANGSC